MAGLTGLLSNPVLEQLLLYNVVGQLIGAALGPYMVALTNQVNQASPLVPLSPQAAAEAVIRNLMSHDAAAGEATFSGFNRERFDTLVGLAGNAPDPGSLAVALRRKLIDQGRYLTGIRQGRLRDEWADLVRQLAVVQPPPAAMLAAYLEGQLDEGEARERYARLGGDPDYFDILYHTEGQAPTPVQALEMLNRGIIGEGGTGPDATSYTQAFLEGPWRNKWLGPFLKLREYLPPPRTVTAMYREGSLTEAEARRYLEQNGLTPHLADAYLAGTSAERTKPARDLSQAMILKLYADRLISRDRTLGYLRALGYSETEAGFIIETAELELTQRALSAAVTRIRTYYVGHKVDAQAASTALAALGVEADRAADLLTVWDQERAANVHLLTPADLAAAHKKGLLDRPTALARLVELGYPDDDAELYLAVHVGPEPAAGG